MSTLYPIVMCPNCGSMGAILAFAEIDDEWLDDPDRVTRVSTPRHRLCCIDCEYAWLPEEPVWIHPEVTK